VLETTVKVSAAMPSKVTSVVCLRLVPVMVTVVPTRALLRREARDLRRHAHVKERFRSPETSR
jgi:hypothetical protein